jgi:ubiquinone/menaquinone biosynthesis C-methylase UbiE
LPLFEHLKRLNPSFYPEAYRSGSNLTGGIIVGSTFSSALQVPVVLEEEDVNSTPYDSIGRNYNQNRTADHRVLAVIKELLELPLGSAIADVGAGTGNYSNALADLGYKLEAVEPSIEMRRQATPNPRVHWLSGSAEAIPLKNNAVDGVIIIVALHHFDDVPRAAREIHRICPKGPIVIFTMDPRKGEHFWLYDYFPGIAKHVLEVFPPIDEVAGIISGTGKWQTRIKKFPLPPDLTDRHMCSGWAKPEMYFDAQMRQNTSGFALASPTIVERGLKRLQHDLKSGQWDSKYGHLRRRKYFNAGFRFLRFIGPKKR